MPRGAVFVPFCYYEAAANMLTNPALDPFGKIPEFKYCAVRVTKGGDVPEHSSFGGGTLLTDAPRKDWKARHPVRGFDLASFGRDSPKVLGEGRLHSRPHCVSRSA